MDILIPLTPIELKKYAIIGIEDRDLALLYWHCANGDKYARCSSSRKKGFMHRFIMERIIDRPLTKGEYVDHIDRNGLNNKRDNLRLATSIQNSFNKCGWGTSKFRGVSFDIDTEKWAVQIHFNNKSTHLGLYNDETTAAQVYDAAAKKYLDAEFVKFNFPDQIFNLSDFGISINEKTGRPKIFPRISKSGFVGVELLPSGKYRARISIKNRQVHLGIFDTPEEAEIAYISSQPS